VRGVGEREKKRRRPSFFSESLPRWPNTLALPNSQIIGLNARVAHVAAQKSVA